MAEPSLRDRAAAVGSEIHELRRQAALASDVRTLVPLKDADRALKREFGRGEPGDSYSALKERICEQLYQTDKAEERVVQRRIANLTANVRREVEAELETDRTQLVRTPNPPWLTPSSELGVAGLSQGSRQAPKADPRPAAIPIRIRPLGAGEGLPPESGFSL